MTKRKLWQCPITGVLVPYNTVEELRWKLLPQVILVAICTFGGLGFLIYQLWRAIA